MKKKARHAIINKFVGLFLHPILKKKFNLKVEKSDLKGPFLVLCNHTTDYDAFFIAKSFKPHIYFVMSDHISSMKVGKLIKYLVSPIPITKSTIDATTVKNIFEIVKSGGSVGIFPEGNKSFSGEMSEMKPSIAKLVKKLQIPLVIYNIEGGYFSSPRWSKVKRKGEVNGRIRRVVTPEEYNNMSNDELFNLIKDKLRVNAYETQQRNPIEFNADNDRAKNIESFMYVCPECKNISSLYGECNVVKCNNCDYHAEYTTYGYLDGGKFTRLDQYDKWQKDYIYSLNFDSYKDDQVITSDTGFEVSIKKDNYKNVELGIFDFALYKDKFIMLAEDEKNEDIIIPLQIITGYAIEGMNGLQLSLSDGRVYRTKNKKPVSALKYTNLISKLNGLQLKF